MRFGALPLVIGALCLSGCGGTVVLHSDNGAHAPRPAPVPETVQVRGRGGLSRDEAVQVVATQAGRSRITRLRVDEVERKKNEWRVEMRGVDCNGESVEIRGRVDRRTGALKSYKLKSDDDHGHHHGKGHSHHDGHDD